MKTKPVVLCLLLLTTVLSACVSATSEPADALDVPSTTPSTIPASTDSAPTVIATPQSTGYYPLATRTGIAEVDTIIAAVESGDPQQLRDLFHFTIIGCTKADGLGGSPKCQDGEAEGTLVDVFPFLGPEGHFMRRDEVTNFPGVDVIGLYAIYKVSETAYSEESYPAGVYAVMFTGGENRPDVVIQVREGIVRIDYLFPPTSLGAVIERDALELVLAPQ